MSDTNNCNRETLNPLRLIKLLNTYSELDWLIQSSVRDNVLSYQLPVSPGVEEDGVSHFIFPGLAGVLWVVDDELLV